MIEPQGETLHVDTNGLRHRVLKYGTAGPSVVIVPGITSPALTAEFLALELHDDRQVYVPDLRGRGGTDVAAPGEYSLDQYVGDIVGLVAALGLTRPVVIGHSLGARIAAGYSVASDGDHDLLVLIDPPLSGPGRDPYPTDRDAFVRQLEEAYRGTNADEVRAFYPKWATRELEIRAQELPTCDRAAVLETHARFHTEDFFELWGKVHQPAVLFRGGVSPVVTERGADELRAARPDIPIVSIPEAGHMVPWDNWPAFRGELRSALDSGSRDTDRSK